MESYRDQLDNLARLFGSARRAAEFLAVSHSQLRSWLDVAVPTEKNLRRIVDGAAVVKALRAKGLDDIQILTELSSIWPELDGRPAELVRAGAAADVLAAVAARYTPAAPVEDPAKVPELVDALLALAAAATASAAALSRGAA